MRQQPKHRTMWACGFDGNGQPFVVEVPVMESKKLYTVVEKGLTGEQKSRVGRAVGFRLRVEKDCRILFDTPEAAVKAKIDHLNDVHAGLLHNAQEVLKQVEAITSLTF